MDGSPKEGTIDFESTAVRHITAAVLDSGMHKARMELARTLLEWQAANAALATAKDAEASAENVLASAIKQWEVETRPIATWFGPKERKPSAETEARKAEASKDRDVATKTRTDAAATLAAKLARIEELRKVVPAAGGTQ